MLVVLLVTLSQMSSCSFIGDLIWPSYLPVECQRGEKWVDGSGIAIVASSDDWMSDAYIYWYGEMVGGGATHDSEGPTRTWKFPRYKHGDSELPERGYLEFTVQKGGGEAVLADFTEMQEYGRQYYICRETRNFWEDKETEGYWGSGSPRAKE